MARKVTKDRSPPIVNLSRQMEISNQVVKAVAAAGLQVKLGAAVLRVNCLVTKPPGFVDLSGTKITQLKLEWDLPLSMPLVNPVADADFIMRVLRQIPFLQTSAETEAPSNGENGHEEGQKGVRASRIEEGQ